MEWPEKFSRRRKWLWELILITSVVENWICIRFHCRWWRLKCHLWQCGNIVNYKWTTSSDFWRFKKLIHWLTYEYECTAGQELANATAYVPSRRCVCTHQVAALFCVKLRRFDTTDPWTFWRGRPNKTRRARRQESLAIAKMTARCALYISYSVFTLILFTLTATILCADFDSERT